MGAIVQHRYRSGDPTGRIGSLRAWPQRATSDWQTARLDNPLPKFPKVDPAALSAIIEFAESFADWLEKDAATAREHGHSPDSHVDLIAGWRFVALGLTEGPL